MFTRASLHKISKECSRGAGTMGAPGHPARFRAILAIIAVDIIVFVLLNVSSFDGLRSKLAPWITDWLLLATVRTHAGKRNRFAHLWTICEPSNLKVVLSFIQYKQRHNIHTHTQAGKQHRHSCDAAKLFYKLKLYWTLVNLSFCRIISLIVIALSFSLSIYDF